MRSRGITAALAGAILALGAGSAEAIQLSAPDVTKTQIKRAIVAAVEPGAKPRELKKPSPAWYDRKAQRRQNRDSRKDDGVTTAPVDAPIPPYVGIRPGALMISPFICTMNFIFQKGGTLAIGTAGHCVEGNEPVDLLTVAPDGGGDPVPVLVRLGRVLLKRDGGVGRDYALVEIPPHLHAWVFPTLSVVGGPCGVFAGGDPQPVAHYGHGLGVGTGGTPRAGMGFEIEGKPPIKIRGADWDWDSDSIVWLGISNGGDSGSGVRIAQMPAVSNLTHGISVTGLDPGVISWGTRVTTITSSGWQLVNSPLCL
jgi:hypothetical protein